LAEPGPPTSLRRATAWSFAMSWGSRGIAALVTFVLAALLDPADFGIIGLAAVYIAFIQLFVEQGLTAALVQRKDLEKEHLDSTFWLVVAVSLLLAGLGVLLSGLWADAKDLPRLRPVILVLSAQPLVAGLTVVPYSLLTRKLDFRALAIRASAAAVAGGAVGVTMALLGLGVWALVGQTLTRVVVELAILWAATDWRPRLRFSGAHLLDLLPFSVKTLAGTLGFFVGNWASTVVLGLFFGPVALGLFRFAERVMQMAADLISRPLGTVALPELSRRQADPEELGRSVLKLTRMVASLVLPAMVVIVVLSDRIVGIVGERWAPRPTC